MIYELEDMLLTRGTADDYELIINLLNSRNPASANKQLIESLNYYRNNKSRSGIIEMAHIIEKEYKYFGSADVAYLLRKFFSGAGGVGANKIIDDVSKRLRVKTKNGTVMDRLASLTKEHFESAVMKMSVEEQINFFRKEVRDENKIKHIIYIINKHKDSIIPFIIDVIGPEATAKLVEGIVVNSIKSIVGPQAARMIFKKMILKFPWWSEWLGPIAWTITTAWLVTDIQGPAYRITVPTTLYFGIISARNNN
jgi:uncharacterized protein YaaW (UPF0174 family)